MNERQLEEYMFRVGLNLPRYSRKVPVIFVILRKNLNFLNSVTETVSICGMTDGRTDMTKPMVSLGNFASP
jgi:hypothetical protein